MNRRTEAMLGWIVRDRASIEGDRLAVPGDRGVLIHQDYGADVLLVAHLDWVGEARIIPPVTISGSVVRHPSLDDRLGCWAIDQLLAAGVHADVLYTDCEEIGHTTGAEFNPGHERYKFVLSLDRAGTDTVLYQYDSDDDWADFCERHMGPIARGSFSCISSMDHLGVCAANVGIGYHDHNGPACWADLRLSVAQIRRTAAFIARARKRRWAYDDSAWLDTWSLDDAALGRNAIDGRLCVTCAASHTRYVSDAHECPYVADCWCCMLSAEYDERGKGDRVWQD